MVGNLEYFQKRLAEEKALLETSDSEQVRSVHRKLADIYAGRLASLGADGKVSPDVSSGADIPCDPLSTTSARL